MLVVATGPYAGEGFDCPALDSLFLAAPIAQKGRLVQYAGRILRPYRGKATAEVHGYPDELTGVLASSLAKRGTSSRIRYHPATQRNRLVGEHSVDAVIAPRDDPVQDDGVLKHHPVEHDAFYRVGGRPGLPVAQSGRARSQAFRDQHKYCSRRRRRSTSEQHE